MALTFSCFVVIQPGNLLVLINQSFYLIYFCYNFFDGAKETNIYENKIEEITFADIDLFYFFSFIFKKKLLFHRRRKPSEKVVIVEEELPGIDIDDIGNLEDSPQLLFIDEERVNPIVANDGVFTKGKGQTF